MFFGLCTRLVHSITRAFLTSLIRLLFILAWVVPFLENDITVFRSSASPLPCYCNPIFCVIWQCQQMVARGGSLTPRSQLSGPPDRPPLSLSLHPKAVALGPIVSLFNPLLFQGGSAKMCVMYAVT